MSRETLLDEAIAKAKECGDWQLVEWLRMARGGESAARWYSDKLREERDENAKLRELCEWLLNPYRLGAVTGEGIDKQWCRETYDGGSYRLRELGVEP